MDSRDRNVWIVLVIIVLVVLLVPGLGWGMMGGGMMGPGVLGGWGDFSPWWSVTMLVFWALLLVGIALFVVWGIRHAGPGEPADRRPLDILKERYARGELTREQYEQIRRDIE